MEEENKIGRKEQSIQWHPTHRSHIVKLKFAVGAISNTGIKDWIKYLRISRFKGVFSRNNLTGNLKNGDSMVINLDHSLSSGTH